MAATEPRPAPRTALGRYQITAELGRGAMGIVYKAHDPRIDRTVVLKTLRRDAIPAADLEEYRTRFQREAKAAGILSHPGIVSVYDVGEDAESGEDFMAMEFVAGATLQSLVAARVTLPPNQVAEIVADVADALHYAHDHGVIHRDVKPANLLLGDGNRVKVADFGVARLAASTLTAEGQALGTPNYMSPEQLTGEPLDGRSDLWSLGVVAYQLLTLENPFAGTDFNLTVQRILDVMPPSPRKRRPEVPASVSDAVMRVLAKDREERYQSGREMASVFRAAAGIAPRRSGGFPRTDAAAPSAPQARDPDPEAAPLTVVSVQSAAVAAHAEMLPPPVLDPEATRTDPRAAGAATLPRNPTRPTAAAAGPGLQGTVVAAAGTAAPQSPNGHPNAGSPRWLLGAAGVGILGLLATLAIAALLATRVLGPDATPPTPTTSMPELMSQERYDEVIAQAEERLRREPGDAEARAYLELARSLANPLVRPRSSPTRPLVALPRAATLALDLTASFSGAYVVSVDGVPVMDGTFATGAKYLLGRPLPGTFRAAHTQQDVPVTAGDRHVMVRVVSRNGRTTIEEGLDIPLPEGGRVTLVARESSDELTLLPRVEPAVP